MEYTYTVYVNAEKYFKHFHVCTRLEEVENEIKGLPKETVWFVEVYDNMLGRITTLLCSKDSLDEWHEARARAISWCAKPKDKVIDKQDKKESWKPFDEKETDIHMADPVAKDYKTWTMEEYLSAQVNTINPSHYKRYIDDMLWIDAMSKIPTLRDPVRFKAAIELQIRKYLDRLGQKGEDLEQLKKSRWYINYLIAYIENGEKPFDSSKIERLKDK